MTESLTEESAAVLTSLSLPLIQPPAPAPRWQGLRPAAQLPLAAQTPEPEFPQGDYGISPVEASFAFPRGQGAPTDRRVELLAPAGGLDAGFAAYHFGADAIYLGLKKFSARAEAENFTLDEVSEITAYAHSLAPRRKVFVTINTLIRQDELAELIDALAHLTAIGVDAIIVQDLGVYRAIKNHFPSLELHASTQLAVHNHAGAAAMQRFGFARVVLARELTFEEVDAITATGNVETEVFIHGALCYSYSGLCLFSAQTLGEVRTLCAGLRTLTAEERYIIARLGVAPAAYVRANAAELAGALQTLNASPGISAIDREVMHRLGLSEAQWLKTA